MNSKHAVLLTLALITPLIALLHWIPALIGAGAAMAAAAGSIFSQKKENEITRDREDNAVQRRAADLRAAGINPLLAAGQAAGASAQSAPFSDGVAQQISDIVPKASAGIMQRRAQNQQLLLAQQQSSADINLKLEQARLARENADKVRIEAGLLQPKFDLATTAQGLRAQQLEIQNRLADNTINVTQLKALRDQLIFNHNMNIASQRGTVYGQQEAAFLQYIDRVLHTMGLDDGGASFDPTNYGKNLYDGTNADNVFKAQAQGR